MKNQNDIYKQITDKFLEELKKGVIPWRKPWVSRQMWPISWRSGKTYRGINLFLLPMVYGEYATFKQINEAGGRVKKGAEGHLVVFWSKLPIKDKETKEETGEYFWLMKTYKVFDILTQATGLKPRRTLQPAFDHDPIAEAETIAAGFPDGPTVSHGAGRAYYRPAVDAVSLPPISDFPNPAEYYSTLFHELVHATGHPERLNRPGVANFDTFGSDQYSQEELVAEIGAAMLCSTAGIVERTIENSVAYVSNWLEKLQNDHRLVVQAAGQAQRAADLILGDRVEAEMPAEESEESAA